MDRNRSSISEKNIVNLENSDLNNEYHHSSSSCCLKGYDKNYDISRNYYFGDSNPFVMEHDLRPKDKLCFLMSHVPLIQGRDTCTVRHWGGGGGRGEREGGARGRLYSAGVRNFFLGAGLKIKSPRGCGVVYFIRHLRVCVCVEGGGLGVGGVGGGGVRCVPLVFVFIKSHSFWGASPPKTTPPRSQLILPTI